MPVFPMPEERQGGSRFEPGFNQQLLTIRRLERSWLLQC